MSENPNVKPAVDADRVRATLEQRLSAPVMDLQPMPYGEMSRVFSFSGAGRAYVVKVATAGIGFAADRLAAERYGSSDLPIPRVVDVGDIDGMEYAVSERAPGVPLVDLTRDQRTALLPAIVRTLDRVHQADVRASSGYGWIGPDGNGLSGSWRDHLLSIDDPDGPGFWKGWSRLFDDSFLERDVWARVRAWFEPLLASCPEERRLVHADFSGANILSDGERITAVLDWANAKYGDCLYDVAYVDWQSPDRGYRERFRALYVERGQVVPAYDARVSCYQAWLGLDGLRFCARRGRRDWYDVNRARLLDLISTAQPV